MPQIMAGAYLFQSFIEAGKLSTAFGLTPLTWVEIDAYARLTGEIETPFEARTIKRLSVAYLDGLKAGEDEFSIPPWGG